MKDQKHYPMPELSEQERENYIDSISTKMRAIAEECDENLQFEYDVLRFALVALTAPKAEPVEWQFQCKNGMWVTVDEHGKNLAVKHGKQVRSLYTAPPVPALKPIKKPGTKCIGWVKEAIHEHDEKWITAIRAAGYEVKE